MKKLFIILTIVSLISISPSLNGLLAQTGTGSLVKELPPPMAGKGHATGIVIVKGQPYKNQIITLIRLTDDKTKAGPDIKTDVNGRWTALNLEPGKYVVFRTFIRGFNTGIVYSSDEVKEVKPGMVADFGTQDKTSEMEKSKMRK